MTTRSRLYPDRAAYLRSEKEARQTCEHGLRAADCELCTRYDGECDLGGCIRPATYMGLNMLDGQVRERRPICASDRDFARSLGLVVVPMHPEWSELQDYDHIRHCSWGHVQKCCPSGCNGEPTDYPMTQDHADFLARRS